MHNSKLLDFYNDRFGSGFSLYQYLLSDITNEAATLGINWDRVGPRLPWKSGKSGKVNASGKDLQKGFSSVGVYASMETVHGIQFPSITLKNKGGAGDRVVINGFTMLMNVYREEKDNTFASEKLNAWQIDRAKREREAARKVEAARVERKQEEARKAAHVQSEINTHRQLSSAGSFVYTASKKIDDILPLVDARQGSDKHGSFISLLLQNIDGKAVGVQRIYEKHITKKDGSKTNKDFTWGMEKDGAFLTIGNIDTANDVYVAEGFATGATIFKAWQPTGRDVAVIVAIDAGNKVKVVEAFKAKRPHMDLIDAVDNDLWKCKQGKGNKGMLVAFELLNTHAGMKAVVPSFESIDTVYQATDWNDLHVYAGIQEVLRQLKGRSSALKLDGDLFENALAKMPFVSLEKHELNKAVMAAVNAGMTMFPVYTPRDVVNMVRRSVEHAKGRINFNDVTKQVKKIWRAKVKTAQANRSFSSRITDAKNRPDHITYQHFNQIEITENVQQYINGLNGIVVVRAGKGSGKTKHLITPGMWAQDYTAYFAHRVSLIGGAEATINKNKPALLNQFGHEVIDNRLPVLHYQDSNEISSIATKLACCINSCLKGKFYPILNNLDSLFIDEASQTLRHITSGGAIAYPVAVFNRLIDMMATTRGQILLADADANDTLVDFCELALQKRNAARAELGLQPEQIHVVELATDSSHITVNYADTDSVFQKSLDELAAGERVLVATDASAEAESLFARMKELNPNKKGLLINANEKVKSKAAEAFCDKPDIEQLKYDYLVYSPAISSGVSLETKHFTKHFGLFRGVVTPSDALQMMHRDRNARDFIIGIGTMHNKREESALNMWLGLILAQEKNQLNVALDRDSGAIKISTDDQQFDRFRLQTGAEENQDKNNFASNLICIMIDEGYQVSRMDVTELQKEKGKAEKEAARDLVKAQELEMHLSETTPTQKEADDIRHKTTISVEDKVRLNRFDIETELQMEVTEDSVKLLRNGGIRKAKNFELLNASPAALRELDEAEVAAGIQPTDRHYFQKRQQMARDIFEIMQVNRETGAGWVTPENAQKALEHITAGDNIHFYNNWAKLGGYIDPKTRKKASKGFMEGFMATFGLKVKSYRLGRKTEGSDSRLRYFITDESWALADGIQTRRNAANITGLKFNSLDGEMIRFSPVNSIEQDQKADHAESPSRKASRWISILKNAIWGLNIPLEYAQNLFEKGDSDEVMEGLDHGVINLRQICDLICGRFEKDHAQTLCNQ
ncbi:plasmid replication protein, CyRepA1 family [Enterovibrio norvegicus]|uniref:plasmid replication protein, CyRepA1 family n=1 Tax=Enterovibrio norvegicus TaxID=188144 RepID=UPI00354BA3E1